MKSDLHGTGLLALSMTLGVGAGSSTIAAVRAIAPAAIAVLRLVEKEPTAVIPWAHVHPVPIVAEQQLDR